MLPTIQNEMLQSKRHDTAIIFLIKSFCTELTMKVIIYKEHSVNIYILLVKQFKDDDGTVYMRAIIL